MNVKRGKISISNLQIKSLAKARKLAQAINTIEEECGVFEVEIEFESLFVCPWIDINELGNTPMEEIVQDLLRQLVGE